MEICLRTDRGQDERRRKHGSVRANMRKGLLLFLFCSSLFAQAPRPPIDKLSRLTDVTISSPINGQVLTFNSVTGKWENQDSSGGGGAVNSVFGRTGAVVAVSGDYSASQVTNAVSTLGSYSNPSWITDLIWSKITSTPTTLVGYGITDAVPNTRTVNGHALSTNVTVTSSDVSLGNVTNDAQTKSAIVPNTLPTGGQILAGNAGATAYAPVTLSGSGATATLSSSGVLTLSAIANATLTNSAITIAGTSTSLGGSITRDTISGVSSNGFLKRTGTNTWTNDSSTYLTGNQSITLSGAVSGSGATSITTSLSSFTSSDLATALTDETGSGKAVFDTSPTLSNPVVGTQSLADGSTKAASTKYADDTVKTYSGFLVKIGPFSVVTSGTPTDLGSASVVMPTG